MAKQTFTTGQVLTAAQMTSLQQTAMGGGSTTAKTTSYVLVAADAGTTVAMNAAGSTTITVNTSLFAAGDSVFIQNWGAGTCTVTAGTATVTTHGSLALGQWEGGTLYFTSSSAAIFFDISQSAGMTNPMTTTGDTIYSSSGSTPARLGIGSTGQVLTVAGGVPTWATAGGSGSNFTLLNSPSGTALNPNASVTVSGISGKDKILVMVTAASPDSGSNNCFPRLRLNSDTGNNYYYNGFYTIGNSTYSSDSFISMTGNPDSSFPLTRMSTSPTAEAYAYALFTGCNSSGVKTVQISGGSTRGGGTEQRSFSYGGYYSGSSTVSSITLFADGAFSNYDAGTIFVYTSA
jgi:hypothetical protein